MHKANTLAHLGFLLAVVLLGGCLSNDDDLLTSSAGTPVVVRGPLSYMLTFDADGATIVLQDSITWHPEVAYFSSTVARHRAGFGTVQITDSMGICLTLDSIKGNCEIQNRRYSCSMPLRLRISLYAFTGAITVVFLRGPAEIHGLQATFLVYDTTGQVRTSFAAGEPVDFRYTAINLTGTQVSWQKGDSRPLCRFTVDRGDVRVADSFEGRAWIMVPEYGEIPAGDSIWLQWRGVTPSKPLPAGQYVAWAEPQIWFSSIGFLADRQYLFEIRQ